MSWISILAWFALTSVFLADTPMLIAAFGERLSYRDWQAYLTLPLLFAPSVLLLTPWRTWVAIAIAAAVMLHLGGHLLWVRRLKLHPAPAHARDLIASCCAAWGAPRPHAILLGAPGPAVIGLMRQRLILPPAALDLPEDDLKVVLAHELAHVAARDPLKLWLAGIGRTLLCWHPLARLDLKGLRLAIELEADAQAAAWIGDSRHYALALGRWGLALSAGQVPPSWGAALAEGPADLVLRIQTLTEPVPPARQLRLPPLLQRAFKPPHGSPVKPFFPHLVILLTMAGYAGLAYYICRS